MLNCVRLRCVLFLTCLLSSAAMADRRVTDGQGWMSDADSGTDPRDIFQSHITAFKSGKLEQPTVFHGVLDGQKFTNQYHEPYGDHTDAYDFEALTSSIVVQSLSFTATGEASGLDYVYAIYDIDGWSERDSLLRKHTTDHGAVTLTGLKANHTYRLYVFCDIRTFNTKYDYEISIAPVAETIRKVTVEFDACQGVASLSKAEYEVGRSYGTFPSASRDGYSFEGWYTSANGGIRVWATDPVEETVVKLYAH